MITFQEEALVKKLSLVLTQGVYLFKLGMRGSLQGVRGAEAQSKTNGR
jgi:hypothetical protein